MLHQPRFSNSEFFSVASVTASLRVSLALWKIGSFLLHIMWSVYFDDFLCLSRSSESKHVDFCVSSLFSLLGWKVSQHKLLDFNTICKVLGVQSVRRWPLLCDKYCWEGWRAGRRNRRSIEVQHASSQSACSSPAHKFLEDVSEDFWRSCPTTSLQEDRLCPVEPARALVKSKTCCSRMPPGRLKLCKPKWCTFMWTHLLIVRSTAAVAAW